MVTRGQSRKKHEDCSRLRDCRAPSLAVSSPYTGSVVIIRFPCFGYVTMAVVLNGGRAFLNFGARVDKVTASRPFECLQQRSASHGHLLRMCDVHADYVQPDLLDCFC